MWFTRRKADGVETAKLCLGEETSEKRKAEQVAVLSENAAMRSKPCRAANQHEQEGGCEVRESAEVIYFLAGGPYSNRWRWCKDKSGGGVGMADNRVKNG